MTDGPNYSPRYHARVAAQLLEEVDRRMEAIDRLPVAEKLHRVATGATETSNANLAFATSLAHAHASTALALAATKGPDGR